MGTLSRTHSPRECTPSISPNNQNALLTIVVAKPKEMKQIGLDAEEKTKASFRESAFHHTSQDIQPRSGEATDTDTVRAARVEVRRCECASEGGWLTRHVRGSCL